MAEGKSSNNLFETSLFAPDTSAYLVIIDHHLPDLILVFIGELHLIFNGNSFENHLILGKCSSLVSQNVPDSSQFFGDCGVPGNASFDQFIVVDIVRVKEFGKVEIDSHGNGDDGAEQNDHSHELNDDVIWFSPLQQDEQACHNEHEEEQEL